MTTEQRPVFVAHDLLDGGAEALAQAHAWAARSGRPLAVGHAIPDPIRLEPLFPQLGVEVATMVSETQRRLKETLTAHTAAWTGRSADALKVVVEPGSAHAIAIEVARDLNAALVVVGATSRGKVERWLMGSTAEQVVRHADAPVLVARPSPSTGVVMVGSDLSETAQPALVAAVEEARRRSAKLVAVHCLDIAHPAMSAFEPFVLFDARTLDSVRQAAATVLRTSLQRAGAETDDETLVVDGSPARALMEAARERSAELLVVGTHGRSGLKRWAMGSVASQVARSAPCSVLVVRSTT